MTPQHLEINGQKLVILPEETYRALLEDAEDKADLHDYLIAKDSPGEFIPYEVVKRLTIDHENPIKVWREYRGLTQTELAKRADTTQAIVSKFESGQDGAVSVLKRIAAALAVDLDDLV